MGLKTNTYGEETEGNQTPELSRNKAKALRSQDRNYGEVISAETRMRGVLMSVDVDGVGIVPVLYVGKEYAHDAIESGQKITFDGSVEYHQSEKVYRTDSINMTDSGDVPHKSDIIQFFIDTVGIDQETETNGDNKHNYGIKQFGLWRIVQDAYADKFEQWRKKNEQ